MRVTWGWGTAWTLYALLSILGILFSKCFALDSRNHARGVGDRRRPLPLPMSFLASGFLAVRSGAPEGSGRFDQGRQSGAHFCSGHGH